MVGMDIEALMNSIDQAAGSFNRLVLLVGPSGSGKSHLLQKLCEIRTCPLLNINLRISQKLLEIPRNKRSRHVDRLFGELLAGCDGDVVALDDLEVLFDPGLQLDPLRLLKVHSRNRTLVASWNGAYHDGVLSYAELDHPEFKSYRGVDVPVVSVAMKTIASHGLCET